MFDKNDVIKWRDQNYRLLHSSNDTAYLYSMKGTGVSLTTVPLPELAAAAESGSAVVVDDPYMVCRSEYALQSTQNTDSKRMEKFRANFALIQPLLDLEEGLILDEGLRNKTLKTISEGNPSKRRQAVRLLSTYWKKGQSEAAMLPDYGNNCNPRNCKRKPGRKFRNPEICPPPLDDTLRDLFRKIIDKHVLKPDGLSVAKAFSLVVHDYLEAHPGATVETAPTINQFRYFYRTYAKFPERLQAKTPSITYKKDKRSLHGSVYNIVDGIGKIYEIDSTKVGVYLVSEEDRTKIVGQPVLYAVSDVYSKMIVGVYVGIESAQYASAAAALVNAMGDKAAFLERYSDNLKPAEWDVSGLPHTLTADNGELSGSQIEAFARSFSVHIDNTQAYRGDQKGTVERALGLIENRIKPHLIAKTPSVRLKKEGAIETRDKAALTLSELRKLVLNAVVDLNNRPLTNTPPDYPSKGLPTPMAIWNWGKRIDGGKSYLQRAPKTELLARSLMPRFEATVSRNGIRAEQIAYDCDRARELGWFERDRLAPRPQKPMLAIDPNNVSNAWLFDTDSTGPERAWPCKLAAESKRYEGVPLFEVRASKAEKSRAFEEAGRTHSEIQGKMYRNNAAIAQAAQEAKPETTAPLNERIREIADNRRKERSYQARKASGREVKAKSESAMNQRIASAAPPNPYEYPDDFEDIE